MWFSLFTKNSGLRNRDFIPIYHAKLLSPLVVDEYMNIYKSLQIAYCSLTCMNLYPGILKTEAHTIILSVHPRASFLFLFLLTFIGYLFIDFYQIEQEDKLRMIINSVS